MATPTVDAQVVADHVELVARAITAWLYIPMLPDEFWAQWGAELVEAIDDELAVCPNACAVMADVTQPIGTES